MMNLLFPLLFEIKADEIITTNKQSFPAGKKFRLEGTSDYLLVYDGVFKITIPFKTFEKIRQGKYTLDAKLHYQACNTKPTLFQKRLSFLLQ